MSGSRRQFIKAASGLAAGSGALALSSCSSPTLTPLGAELLVFKFGVASGDPMSDRVILWTHISLPDNQAGSPAAVTWKVATDPQMSNIVRSSDDNQDSSQPTTTDGVRDYTYKVDVTGLSPATSYYYQFESLGQTSAIGRTRTAPSGDSEQLRFAVCSCSKYHHGFWNSYRHIAERTDLDAVIHLGDYIYEEGMKNSAVPGREFAPDIEVYSLAEYRQRHALFKSDPDLQEAHRQHPFITVWDDHEVADNAYNTGAHRHDESNPDHGTWADRKLAATRSYDEWMPIRTVDRENLEKIYRVLRYGNLLDLILIDARLIGRTEEIEGFTNSDPPAPGDPCEASDPNRSILGATQRDWFLQELSDSTATWRVIGNQVMLAQLYAGSHPNVAVCGGGAVLNSDQWDGYRADQETVMAHLLDNNINNNVVLTGDIHSSWACELTPDTDTYGTPAGSTVGVEFICPGITSNPNSTLQQFEAVLTSSNAHIKYLDTAKRGYFLLNVTTERAQAEWNYVETLLEPNSNHSVDAVWYSDADSNTLVDGGTTETSEKPNPPAPAPS